MAYLNRLKNPYRAKNGSKWRRRDAPTAPTKTSGRKRHVYRHYCTALVPFQLSAAKLYSAREARGAASVGSLGLLA